MTVAELITKLQELPPDLKVYCYDAQEGVDEVVLVCIRDAGGVLIC